jgi:plasmid stability protein
MPSVQIKNVPDDVHRTLRTRAAANGQSLQEFLLALLVEEASHESLDEVLDRLEHMPGRGSFTADDVLDAIHADRKFA